MRECVCVCVILAIVLTINAHRKVSDSEAELRLVLLSAPPEKKDLVLSEKKLKVRVVFLVCALLCLLLFSPAGPRHCVGGGERTARAAERV